jgi:hypothetical protein
VRHGPVDDRARLATSVVMLAASLTLALMAGAPPTFGAEKLETPHLALRSVASFHPSRVDGSAGEEP